jgi:hypothetical protein
VQQKRTAVRPRCLFLRALALLDQAAAGSAGSGAS